MLLNYKWPDFCYSLFHIKGALYLKDPLSYLTVFIFSMWSWSSLLVLYKLIDTFFGVILIKISKKKSSFLFYFVRIYILEWAIFRFPTNFFFWIFFHMTFTIHRTTGEGGGLLVPVYHFHPLHEHFSRVITAKSLHLHLASDRAWTGNLWFPAQVSNH